MIRYTLIFILGFAIASGHALPDGRGSERRTGSTGSTDGSKRSDGSTDGSERRAGSTGGSKRSAGSTEPRASASGEKATTVVIPAGAVESAPGVYKHTDSSGKNWIYRKTPFGIVKAAETPETDRKAAGTGPQNSTAPTVTAVEEGDDVRFERSTPFGPYRWTRKKSELSADEQEILERSRTRKSENSGTKK